MNHKPIPANSGGGGLAARTPTLLWLHTFMTTVRKKESVRKKDNSQKIWKPVDLVLMNTLHASCLSSAGHQPRIVSISWILVWVPTKPIEPYVMRSNAIIALLFVSTTWGKQSIFHHTHSQYYNFVHESVFTQARNERRIEIYHKVIASTLQGLVESYALLDIFTIDGTQVVFRWSLVAN